MARRTRRLIDKFFEYCVIGVIIFVAGLCLSVLMINFHTMRSWSLVSAMRIVESHKSLVLVTIERLCCLEKPVHSLHYRQPLSAGCCLLFLMWFDG